MGVYREALAGLREGYEKLRRLVDERSAADPPDDPHASRYAARRVVEALSCSLDAAPPSLPRRKQLRAALDFEAGALAIDCEETSAGEAELEASLVRLVGVELEPASIAVAVSALNRLGLLASQRGDPVSARATLERAESLAAEFGALGAAPYAIAELFSDDAPSPGRGALELEKLSTLTLYYLAQVHGALENELESAAYCHATLGRQLRFDRDGLDRVEWALDSATLSQFFVEKGRFSEARHHLAAASFSLDEHEREGVVDEERFAHRSADVARCWAKYGLALLSASRERLLRRADELDDEREHDSLVTDLANLKLPARSLIAIPELGGLRFCDVDLTSYESQVTCEFVLIFDDAKPVFHTTKQWLTRASAYYTLENLASDHVQIMQDSSQLYKCVAFFEDDDERRAKMHKRRIDILEKVIRDLNPTYYLSSLRQIWYELAEVYQEILNIKVEKLRSTTERPTPHALNKINNSADKSIEYYKKFIDSFKRPSSEEMLNKFPPEIERAALSAYFRIGSLYTKLIVLDTKSQITNAEETLKAYKSFVKYCEVNEGIAESVKTELNVCREMIDLLPFKIQKLEKELRVPE